MATSYQNHATKDAVQLVKCDGSDWCICPKCYAPTAARLGQTPPAVDTAPTYTHVIVSYDHAMLDGVSMNTNLLNWTDEDEVLDTLALMDSEREARR